MSRNNSGTRNQERETRGIQAGYVVQGRDRLKWCTVYGRLKPETSPVLAPLPGKNLNPGIPNSEPHA